MSTNCANPVCLASMSLRLTNFTQKVGRGNGMVVQSACNSICCIDATGKMNHVMRHILPTHHYDGTLARRVHCAKQYLHFIIIIITIVHFNSGSKAHKSTYKQKIKSTTHNTRGQRNTKHRDRRAQLYAQSTDASA